MCLGKEYPSFLFLIPRGSQRQKVRSLIANRKHKQSVLADWTSDQVGGEWKKQQREADVSKTHQRRRLISHLVNQWNTQHQEEESFAFGLSPSLSAAHHYPYFCYALPFADKRAIKHRLRPIKVKQCYKILKLCISKRRTATLSSRQKQIKKLIVLSFASSGNRDADKSIGKRKESLAARGTRRSAEEPRRASLKRAFNGNVLKRAEAPVKGQMCNQQKADCLKCWTK